MKLKKIMKGNSNVSRWIVRSKRVPGDSKAFDITVRTDNGEEKQTRILAMRIK